MVDRAASQGSRPPCGTPVPPRGGSRAAPGRRAVERRGATGDATARTITKNTPPALDTIYDFNGSPVGFPTQLTIGGDGNLYGVTAGQDLIYDVAGSAVRIHPPAQPGDSCMRRTMLATWVAQSSRPVVFPRWRRCSAPGHSSSAVPSRSAHCVPHRTRATPCTPCHNLTCPDRRNPVQERTALSIAADRYRAHRIASLRRPCRRRRWSRRGCPRDRRSSLRWGPPRRVGPRRLPL
jgi:hypothetical protein